MFSPPALWLKLMTPGTLSVTPSPLGPLMLFGGFGPMMQRTVRMPGRCRLVPVGISVTRLCALPPQKLSGSGSPRTSPQPYDWYSRRSVASHVPPARTVPVAVMCVNAPSASTDFGCTENSPSPVIEIVSPFAATPMLGTSINSWYVCGVLSATAVVGTSTNAAANPSTSRITRLIAPLPPWLRDVIVRAHLCPSSREGYGPDRGAGKPWRGSRRRRFSGFTPSGRFRRVGCRQVGVALCEVVLPRPQHFVFELDLFTCDRRLVFAGAKRVDEDHLFPAMTQRAAAPGSGLVFGQDLVAGLLGHGAPGW